MWEILGIEPTRDIKKIKDTYSEKLKKLVSCENTVEIIKLKDAYRLAINLALHQNGNQNPNHDLPIPQSTEEPSLINNYLLYSLSFDKKSILENENTQFDFSELDEMYHVAELISLIENDDSRAISHLNDKVSKTIKLIRKVKFGDKTKQEDNLILFFNYIEMEDLLEEEHCKNLIVYFLSRIDLYTLKYSFRYTKINPTLEAWMQNSIFKKSDFVKLEVIYNNSSQVKQNNIDRNVFLDQAKLWHFENVTASKHQSLKVLIILTRVFVKISPFYAALYLISELIKFTA